MRQQLEEEIFGAGEHLDPDHPTPKQNRAMHNFAALVVALVVLVGGGFAAYHFIGPRVESFVQTDDYAGPGSGQVDIEVAEGDTGSTIAATLVKAGVVKTTSAFIKASSDNAELSTQIQPGTYTLKKEMTAKDALTWLANPAHRSVPRVTIPEGLWASEIYQRLSKASGIPVKDYRAAAKDTKGIGLPSEAKGIVEGWLFPSTYEFPKKSTAKQQLKLMVQQAVSVMTNEGIAKDKWEETMIMASIVESEAGTSADRRKVARVFYNRLEHPEGETVGLLQSDATISYGAGRRAIAPTDAELKDESNPYNTRFHKGLPPGPISNPGKDSLDAASHPATGPWFFFVTVNPETGETKFSTTYAQFLKDSAEFQNWCKANPKAKC